MNPTVVPAKFVAIDQFSSKVARMSHSAKRFAAETVSRFNAAGKSAFEFGRKTAILGAVVAAPLVLSAKSALDFEEKMADVGKTTGMQGKELNKFGDDLLKLSTNTRTSIDDLAAIAEIGGQLGIPRKEMLKFTEAANKFNIALGADFSGGVEEAVTAVGKIKVLFKETREMDTSEAIMRTGSAINELGAVGAGTSANIADFTLRMGALPDALKMSAQNTLALGTYLEELGVNSQIGAGGMTNLLLVAGKNINAFASQMNMSAKEAKALLAQDPLEFAKKFSMSFKGLAPEKLAQRLEILKVGSQETIKVVGAMGSGFERLTELQKISADAFEKNTSLQTEAQKKEATAAAQMAKLRNNMKALSITVGNALLPVLNDLVQAVMPMIKSAAAWISRNRGLTGTIVKVSAAVAGMSFAVSGLSYVFGGLQKASVIASAAVKLLGITTAAAGIPLLAIAGTLAVVGTAVYMARDAWRKLHVEQSVAADVSDRVFDKTIDQRIEIQTLFNTLRRAKEGTDQYKEALQKINDMSPGLVEKYKLQEKNLRSIERAEKDLTRQVMARAKAEAEAELLKEAMKEEMRLKREGPSMWMRTLGAVTGNNTSIDILHQADIAEQQKRQRVLSKSISDREMQAANPEQAKQQSFLNQVLNINFTGIPAEAQATVNGQPMNTSGNNQMKPKLGSTR